MANFKSDESFEASDFKSEISFDIDEEILVTDDASENEPLGLEVLELPMFNLLLNIYN